MSSTSRLSSKGQVTIPQEVRVRLGLRPGDRVEFVTEDGRTVLRPVRERARSFREYIGVFPHFRTRREINDWISEIRGRNPDDESGWE